MTRRLALVPLLATLLLGLPQAASASSAEDRKAANHRTLQSNAPAVAVRADGVASGFGVRGEAYQVGDWTVHFPADASDACIWRDGGDLAVEVIAGSVGWFHLRQKGRMTQECTYYTSHECSLSESVFYRRPFEDSPVATPVTAAGSLVLADPSFETQRSTVFVTPEAIRVVLDDGGELRFPASARTLTYTDADGTTVTLPK